MIVLLETVHPDAHELLGTAGEVRLVRDPPVLDDDLDPDAVQALVTRGRGRVTADTFALLPRLQVVARCGAGLDNIDTDAAAAAGVAVAHAPGCTTDAVAEHALLLMLALARQVVALDAAVKRGHWSDREAYEGVELRGRRMGVIGLGAIGTRIGELGEMLGMDVVCHTRSRETAFPRLELAELVQTSDVIQLCVPLTPGTTGLIGVEQFAQMKPGAMLINTARGAVVDHGALTGALEAGSLGGYAADVWEPEPPTADDRALIHPRTLITPHVAGLTDVTYREICVRPAAAVVAVLTGARPDDRSIYRGMG
ncbi:MAG: phosphoglycerate dehydrogenase [Acidimicrobiia bacterium]|nr:phosphoglycerate dehydrogenase [Acidimicrobiia bacterium]